MFEEMARMLIRQTEKIQAGLLLSIAGRHVGAIKLYKNGTKMLGKIRLRVGWKEKLLPDIGPAYSVPAFPWKEDAPADEVFDVLERASCFADDPKEPAMTLILCDDEKMKEEFQRGGGGLTEIPPERFPKPRPQKEYKPPMRKKDRDEIDLAALQELVRNKDVPPGSLRIHSTPDGDLAVGLATLRFGALEGAGIKYGDPMTCRELRTLLFVKAFCNGFGLSMMIGSADACRAFSRGLMTIIPPAVEREKKSKYKRR